MFNSPTDIGGYFTEQVAPGAFAAAIGRDDVRALFNHDPNFVIARTTNKTLTLSEDDKGLYFEATPPDTQWARDLVASIDRGDVSQCSFGFIVTKCEWDETVDPPIRTIMEVELLDVSPVTYPAYEDTSVSMRALKDWREANTPAEKLIGAVARTRMKHELFEHITI
jgi:HK97 family phage prohead protease